MREIEELRYLILALQREGNRLLAARLRPLGLTPAQGEAISLLAAHQPLSLTGLGELLICESGTNPSRIVDRLTIAGLVRRETDPVDRRHVLLTLTPDGARLAAEVAATEQTLETWFAELIGDQPTAPTLTLLRSLAARLPAGEVMERRRALPAR